MNKKELTRKLMKRMEDFGYFPTFTNVKTFIKEYEKLAKPEPQKPVVPEFVHKYIREAKECSWDFQDLFKYIDDEDSEKLQKWFYHECNQETLAIAWINGYEIEEEKRYTVKIKGHIYENILVYGFGVQKYFFSSSFGTNKRGEHTRKELENDGFGWVFDCPGIYVEEVER